MIEDSPHLFVHLPTRKETIQTSVDPVGTLVRVMKQADKDMHGRVSNVFVSVIFLLALKFGFAYTMIHCRLT